MLRGAPPPPIVTWITTRHTRRWQPLTSLMCGLMSGSCCQQAVMRAHMLSGMALGREGRYPWATLAA